MDVETYRDFCLSLNNVEEKMPFSAFKSATDVLVFYINNHIFSFFDVNIFDKITLKCFPDKILELKEQYSFIENPYNMSPKYWIGINPRLADNNVLKQLTITSYNIVKEKYKKTR